MGGTGKKVKTKQQTKNIQYNLVNVNECGQFVNEKKTGRFLAHALILSLFEATPISEVPAFVRGIIKILPQGLAEEQRALIEAEEIYLSLDTILNAIHGVRCEATVEGKNVSFSTNCIQFKEYQKHHYILKNFWELFPELRLPLIKWIFSILDVSDAKTGFFYYQIINAIVSLMQIDYMYGLKEILPRLISSKNNIPLIWNVLEKLYKDAEQQNNINNLLVQWLDHDKKWLWKMSCLAYAKGWEGRYYRRFEKFLLNKILFEIEHFENLEDTLLFLGHQIIYSERLRNLISEILGEIFKNKGYKKGKYENIVTIFFLLIYHSYMDVNSEQPYLPFIVPDSREQMNYLSSILNRIILKKFYRDAMFNLLTAYLLEIDEYELKTKRLKNFFLHLAYMGDASCSNLLFFLNKNEFCDCRVVREISDFLNARLNLK